VCIISYQFCSQSAYLLSGSLNSIEEESGVVNRTSPTRFVGKGDPVWASKVPYFDDLPLDPNVVNWKPPNIHPLDYDEQKCSKKSGLCVPDRTFPICSWAAGPFRYLPQEPPKTAFVDVLRFYNYIGLRYVLFRGTALGAIRNGGMIPADGDFDLDVPIWLNTQFFPSDWICSDFGEASVRFVKHDPKDRNNWKLCGRTYATWLQEFGKALQKIQKDIMASGKGPIPALWTKTLLANRPWGGYRVFGISDLQFVFEHTRITRGATTGQGGICRCLWSGYESYCIEEDWERMEAIYGQDWPVQIKNWKHKDTKKPPAKPGKSAR
jgi:hypothetical protein